MRGNIVLIVSLVLFVDLIFAQEVKFDPEKATVAVGQVTQVRCYLEPATQADAQYIWYDKQGAEVTATSSSSPKYIRNVRPPMTGKLLYVKVEDGDAGKYLCKIIVDNQEYEGHFQLDTYATITLDDSCKDAQHGTKGKEGRVFCKATAGGVNLYTYWERDGKVLDANTQHYRFDSSYMAITNVSDADKGDYTYVAEPSPPHPLIPIKTKIIYFDVYELPVLEKPISSNESPIAGGNLTLFCSAKAYPEVVFTWYKEDSAKPLESRDRIQIRRFKDQSQLQFNPVRKDDEGMYRCVASNAAGDAESTATITVHTPPEIQEMKNKTETENNGAILICDAYGDPRPKMEWKKVDTGESFAEGDQTGGKSVSTGDIGDIGNPGTQLRLEFISVQHQDAGNYMCVAANGAGRDTKIVNLQVLFGPNFAEQPDGPFYNWKGNTDGYLPCVVRANPLPVFQWFRVKKGEQDTEITPGSSFFGITREEEKSKFKVTSKLMITYNGQNDAETIGDFKCVARNSINVTSRVLNMEKAGTPGKPTMSKSLETATQLHLSLVASGVKGPPVMEFVATVSRKGSNEDPRVVSVETEWRNWVDDLPTPRTTMMIDNLSPQTAYSIRLVAINAVGEGTPVEFEHTTKARSKPQQVIILSDINSLYPNSIVVRWTPPDDGGAPIVNYTVEYRPVIAKNTTSAEGEYEFDRAIQGQVWKSVVGIKPGNNRYTITNLIPGTTYQVQVRAINNQGPSNPKTKIIKTKDEALPPAGEVKGAGQGLSTGVIVGIVIAIFVVLFIIVDVTCYFKNNCGILMSIREKIAGTRDEGYSAAKTDDVENLAKKDQLEDAKSAEEGELAAEQDDPDEEKKAPLLSEEQTVETVDEGEKKTEEMEPEDKEAEKQQETIDNKENEAAQEETKTEEKADDEPEGEKKG